MVATDPKREIAIPSLTIKIEGQEPDEALTNDLVDVVVDERLHQPTMFEIRFRALQGPQGEAKFWTDDPKVQEGKQIEILAGMGAKVSSLCVGKVVAVEADLDEQMPLVTVRGYDLGYPLHRGAQTRSFLNVTDSDVARKIAGEVGLSATTDSTSETFPYLAQHSETNYEFLHRRAERLGFELRVDQRQLLFRKPAPQGAAITLEWGTTCHRFRPQLSAAEQVNTVEVRGWDVKKKQAIVGTATTGASQNKTGVNGKGGDTAKKIWGQTKRTVVDIPVESQADATKIAQALLDDLTSDFITAEGECVGDPKLRVGAAVAVQGVGKRFSGTYYLTGVTHRIDKASGYLVSFTASTRRPSALAALLRPPDGHSVQEGVVVGIVTNNQDPDKLGRVKVKFPWLDEQMESNWARLASPMAGGGRGWLNMPEVNDEVLLAFEHGDPRRPYVLGVLWNGKDAVPEMPNVQGVQAERIGGDGKVNLRYWRSRTGHAIIFDDTKGGEGIYIIDKTRKNFIKITAKENKLEVETDGDISIRTVHGQMSLMANKDIAIESETGKITIKAAKEIETRSGTDTKITVGANMETQVSSNSTLKIGGSGKVQTGAAFDHQSGGAVTIQTGAALTIRAATSGTVQTGGALSVTGGGGISLTSGASFGITASGPLSVTGSAVVSITGGAPVSITAPMINLN